MVEIKAIADSDMGGTNVEASYDGKAEMVMEECIAIVMSVYEDSKQHGFNAQFLGAMCKMLCEWVEEYNDKGGETLA